MAKSPEMSPSAPLPTRADVQAAAERIRGHILPTPTLLAQSLSEEFGFELYLKAENLQEVSAFKARGAINNLLQLDEAQRASTIITYSSGNHGQAVAWACRTLDLPCRVFTPVDAPEIKVANMKRLGATVVPVGTTSLERKAAAEAYAQEHDATIVEPFDHAHTICGQGTATLELLEAAGELDQLFVPVGGGGLIAGACLALEGTETELLAVEPEGCNSMGASLDAGELVAVEPGPTLADGLKPTQVGQLNFDLARRRVGRCVTVNDEEIGRALVKLLLQQKLLVEPSAAAALAAAMKHGRKGARVGVLLSGGNIAPALLRELLSRYAV